MDNFSRLFAVFQSSTHKSVNLKRPFHSFIVNICQCSGAVIAVTGESRGPAMASQLHRFGNVKDYRPFHSGRGSQQVRIFWDVIPVPRSRTAVEQTRARGQALPSPALPSLSPSYRANSLVPGGHPGRHPAAIGGRRWPGRVWEDPRLAPPHDARPPSLPSPGSRGLSPLLCPLFNFHSAF